MVLKKLISEFMIFKGIYTSTCSVLQSENSSSSSPSSSFITKNLLKSLYSSLIKVYNRLSLPASTSLRSLSRSKLRTIFKPELPKNLILNVYCKNGCINVDLNFIQLSSTSTFNKNPNNKNLVALAGRSFNSSNNSQVQGQNSSSVEPVQIENSDQNKELENNLYSNSHYEINKDQKNQTKNSSKLITKPNQVTYEVSSEFNHPIYNNAVFKVINTVQLKAEISWLYISQNLIKEAVEEVEYCLKHL